MSFSPEAFRRGAFDFGHAVATFLGDDAGVKCDPPDCAGCLERVRCTPTRHWLCDLLPVLIAATVEK